MDRGDNLFSDAAWRNVPFVLIASGLIALSTVGSRISAAWRGGLVLLATSFIVNAGRIRTDWTLPSHLGGQGAVRDRPGYKGSGPSFTRYPLRP
jgi:hypothetical protein